MIARGDIRWHRFAQPDKRRPVLVIGRADAISSLSQIVVVPCSTTIRGLTWEVPLDDRDGLVVPCVLKMEWIRAVPRVDLGARITTLRPERWQEVRHALLAGLGFDS